MKVYALRLKPGTDLKNSIEEFVKQHKIEAGWIVTCAGSLTRYNIRFANNREGTNGSGYFEIVSLTGTLSINGCHLHVSISDSTGKTIGGHLLPDCIVYTTAEIIIQESENYVFSRAEDGTTPYKELKIGARTTTSA
jgi:predicted DNA-binding protein with PD1-like motif